METKVNRLGQDRALDVVEDELGRRSLVLQLPTGYGKTYTLVLIYNSLASKGILNRLCVVTANTTQQEQMIDALKSEYGKNKVRRYEKTAKMSRLNRQGRLHIIVTTIQQVHACSTNGKNPLLDLIQDRGNWMVVADESHHLGDGMAWANAIREICDAARFVLAMSATPYRDGPENVFGKPDVVVTYVQAKDEGAVSVLKLFRYEYEVVLTDADGEEIRLTATQLRAAASGEGGLDSFEHRNQLRWTSGYIQPLIRNPVVRLIETREAYGIKFKMLVRALGCNHARHIAETMHKHFQGLSVDWIGTGPCGRSDETNAAVRNEFKTGNLDVLVQVGMAGEGFDVCEITEIVDFANVRCEGASTETKQLIGRGARIVPGYPHIPCNVSVGMDHPLARLPKRKGVLHEWMDSDDVKDVPVNKEREDEDEKDWWEDVVIACDFPLEQRVKQADLTLIESEEDLLRFVKDVAADERLGLADIDMENPDHRSIIVELYTGAKRATAEEEDEEAEEARYRDQVNRLTKNIAKMKAVLIARDLKQTGQTVDMRDLLATQNKRLNVTLKRKFGPRESLTLEELKALEDHLLGVQEDIVKRAPVVDDNGNELWQDS